MERAGSSVEVEEAIVIVFTEESSGGRLSSRRAGSCRHGDEGSVSQRH